MIFQTFKTIQLLLPALVPSWRFFDEIAPSPRIEFALLEAEQEISHDWQEFRPRQARLSVGAMLKNLFWNPRWNETLFLVSCAERLIENPANAHSRGEISTRIEADLLSQIEDRKGAYFQFRLVSVSREGQVLQRDITYLSPLYHLSGDHAS